MRSILSSIVVVGLIGCGGSTPPASTAPVPYASSSAAPAPVATTEAPAHKLVVQANACWFGGIWADAEREPPEARRASVEARCRDVLRTVYGNDDKTKLEQLRAFDAGVIGDLGAKVETLAAADPKDAPRKDALGKIVSATAAAQREATEARRAAERVKRDLDREPDKLTKDEADAVAALTTTKELDALIALDVGELSSEAHAIGFITAMDRIAISRGLPKHLKVYALSGTMKDLFGATPPSDMPTDATKPLKKGLYLSYLTDVAKAAGHPVADTAKTPREKDGLAWAGVLQGVSDKIKANADQLAADTELHEVSLRVANRLAAWYDAEKNAVATVEKSKADAKSDKKK